MTCLCSSRILLNFNFSVLHCNYNDISLSVPETQPPSLIPSLFSYLAYTIYFILALSEDTVPETQPSLIPLYFHI